MKVAKENLNLETALEKEWIITNNIKVPLTAQCRTKTNELGFDIANYLFKSGSMVYVQYNTIALNIDFENQTATLKSAGTNNNSFNTTIFTDTVREL